jgi:hypothetical protein
MQGTITTKSPITLEDPKLAYTLSGNTNVGAATLFDTIYLQIGSSTMTWSANNSGTASFLGLATVNSSAQVKVYAKLRDQAAAGTFKFADLRLSSFDKVEYVSNQNTVQNAVGTISAVSVAVTDSKLSATRVDGLGNTKVAVGSKAVTVNGLNLAVTQGNDVSVSNAEYTVTGSGNFLNNAFATLYVDGQAVSTKTISSTGVTFDGLTKTVGKTPVNLTVKVDFSDAYEDGTFSMKLSNLSVVDVLTSKTVTGLTVPTSAVFTVAQAKGTLSASDANPKASLLLAGDKDQKVLAFRVKAENDSVKLRDVVFSGTNLDNLSNFRLLTPTNKYVASTSNTATNVEFKTLELDDAVAMDKTETYYLVADVNTNVNASFSVVLDKALTYVKGSNGLVKLADASSVNVSSNTHLVAENKAVVAKSSNASKDISTSALRFSVTASGKDQVTLSGATFNNLLSGYTGSAMVKVYKDTIQSANLLGSGSHVNGTDVVVSFNNNKTVDAGSTNNYIVVVEGVVIDSNANTPSWTVRLADLSVVSGSATISAKAYNNMGEFPLTETK